MPFFVRPPRGPATEDVVLLSRPCTYLAYANEHIHEDNPGAQLVFGHTMRHRPGGRVAHEHREFGLSIYDLHATASGVCYSSWLRPILNMRPDAASAPRSLRAAYRRPAPRRLARAQGRRASTSSPTRTCTTRASTARALPRRPHRLRTRSTTSRPMLDALEAYVDGGGRLMYLGGNGFYWVTTPDPASRTWSRSAAGTSARDLAGASRARSTTPRRASRRAVALPRAARRNGSSASASPRTATRPHAAVLPHPGELRPARARSSSRASATTSRSATSASSSAAPRARDRPRRRRARHPAHALVVATATGYSDHYQALSEEDCW